MTEFYDERNKDWWLKSGVGINILNISLIAVRFLFPIFN